MQRRVVAEELLRKGRVHRHRADCQIAYDDSLAPPNPHLVAAVKRYDRNLFFRRNIVSRRWELWRWVSEPAATAHRMPPDELVRRAVFVKTVQTFDGRECDPDYRILEYLSACDNFKKGLDSPEKMADHMDEVDRQRDVRDKLEQLEAVEDWKRDNKFQIRSGVGKGRIISHAR